MNISIVSCVFLPEPVISARTSADLAQTLATDGHTVRVITPFPNRPAGKLYQGYRRGLWKWDLEDQEYKILRVFSLFSARSDMLSRFLENISFGIASALAVLLLDQPDVIYANTWPIFGQAFLALACKLRRIPLIVSIQDLYPESLFIQKRGIGRTDFLYQFLRWLDVRMARNCAGLIVISEKFKEVYIKDRQIPEDKITVIPNWTDEFLTVTSAPNDDFRKRHNIPDDAFLVIYGGNIGKAAGMKVLVEAFRRLEKRENIYLLLAGAGNSLPECVDLIGKYQLKRVKIHSPWQVSETNDLLSSANLCILPTQGEQSLVSVPSKLLSYMLANRCVLAVAAPESETARVLHDSQAGWVISTEDPDSLAATIYKISCLTPIERNTSGEAGGKYVRKHFSTSRNLPKVVELLVHKGSGREQNSPYASW